MLILIVDGDVQEPSSVVSHTLVQWNRVTYSRQSSEFIHLILRGRYQRAVCEARMDVVIVNGVSAYPLGFSSWTRWAESSTAPAPRPLPEHNGWLFRQTARLDQDVDAITAEDTPDTKKSS